MKKGDIKILDNWFLKNENCTYKEFCDVYNNGKDLEGDLPFMDFPKEILKIFQGNIEIELNPIFSKFLESEGIKDLYIDTLLLNTKGSGKTKDLIDFFKRNLTFVNAGSEYFTHAIDFTKTKEGSKFWNDINKKWAKFYQ
jgi:hypothetical protein